MTKTEKNQTSNGDSDDPKSKNPDTGELDLSALNEMDDIDWSDVEDVLQENRECLLKKEQAANEADAVIPETEEERVFRKTQIQKSMLRTDIDLKIETGRCRMRLDEVAKLTIGSSIEFDHYTGKLVNVYAGDQLVARGQVVAEGSRFGVRIQEVIR